MNILKTLNEILTVGLPFEIKGSDEIEISGITLDSRKAVDGFLFAAIQGFTLDGHQFIEKAIESGAVAVLCEKWPDRIDEKVTYIKVEDSSEMTGRLASAYYDYPSNGFELVGITGTNGKTTVATILYRLFTKLGYKVGLVSTVENIIAGKTIPAQLTTPDSVALNELMWKMNEEGCEYVFMEVSSHAVDQNRIAGLNFRGGVFTNISHDHLDYHKTFKAYISAKKKFFDELKPEAFALTNSDDRNGEVMIQNTKANKRRYSLRKIADYKSKIMESSVEGLQLEMNNIDVHLKLVGQFNAYNATAVFGVAMELDQDRFKVLQILSSLQSAEGRFDLIKGEKADVFAIVDYAHTPDALEKVLDTIQKLKGATTQIITVVGCGGNRDKSKRPKMAKIASEKSDRLILTSDNPRNEDPEDIIDDMVPGIPQHKTQKMIRISERRSAIIAGLSMAQAGDIVLIAGKGHEKYQEIKGERFPFDDKEIVREFLGQKR
ncbi:UDP-N-acetylmuramoyl-L-alanyl-D-glutamate--2,6-diaminopimelate ligase [Portibacter lacus]|uniref:UDP-N-acetylmuramoyl-L-alanyl-D-glutamate--2,6-diaminopimelate ligase n=1 Tax=Portibacter lacus TaxID=1099794 RepID=A0AA37SMV2_9BACT|nr:UDP-N-acetylmuramoyl-L-alanyl-D-glutamate--2,6-diaminopimelate ligase [Portibacter lacus]GLR15771.1 UDP-N-acetylmuramoyl-L-alanyl-D-glutamate--2,6-diaminopimelate ligase [Portibacter lacus]